MWHVLKYEWLFSFTIRNGEDVWNKSRQDAVTLTCFYFQYVPIEYTDIKQEEKFPVKPVIIVNSKTREIILRIT